jgi:hypothetical protein
MRDVHFTPGARDDLLLPTPHKKDKKSVDQAKINVVVSLLKKIGVDRSATLSSQFENIFYQIVATGKVFKKGISEASCDRIVNEAIRQFNKHSDHGTIRMKDQDFNQLHALLARWNEAGNERSTTRTSTAPVASIETAAIASKPLDPFTNTADDLYRVTSAYDKVVTAHEKLKQTQDKLTKLVSNTAFSVCPVAIIGAGDAGVTQWLENYKASHGKLSETIDNGQMPDALIIGETLGNWKEDYTLAQPQNIIERENAESNPSDYMSTEEYRENPYVNARHLYQANVVSLAATDAPLLLGTKVVEIAKRENHPEDWQHAASAYRIKIVLPDGVTKTIYTDRIDLATGFGVAKNPFPGTVIDSTTYEELSAFNGEFTPIVDGNQFMLSTTEEQSDRPRTILVYGGGGNATACFRKGFFGSDKGLIDFTPTNQKNNVLWVSRSGFETAGYGTMAKTSILYGKNAEVIYSGDIRKIIKDPATNKIKIQMVLTKSGYEGEEIHNTKGLAKVENLGGVKELFEIECDQFVYSVGQDASRINPVIAEFREDLIIETSAGSRIPVGLKTPDDGIHVLGAAAAALSSEKGAGPRYSSLLREWIVKEKLPPDTEWPGVLPPSREGIKAAGKTKPSDITEVNVNLTDTEIIKEFLKSAGVKTYKIQPFIQSLLAHRKTNEYGISRVMLTDLLIKFGLNDKVKVFKHSFLKKINE